MENLLFLGVPILKHITVFKFCYDLFHIFEFGIKSAALTGMLNKVNSADLDEAAPLGAVLVCTVGWPGRVAQSVGHLTRKSGVLGSIPGLATYFRFSFRFFKKGSCQLSVTGESMCTKYWLTA